MTTNASPQFKKAQGRYLAAETLEEKIICLGEMLKEAPKHKSSENLLANLRTRKKKFINELDKSKKAGKSTKGIKKHEMQAIIIGKTNSGKSSLLKLLTNAHPKVSEFQFTTIKPEIGMMGYATTQMQIIENPPIDSPRYNKSLTNSADTLIILIKDLDEIKEITSKLKAKAKQIIAFNKIDLLNHEEKRKLEATLKSKKYNYVLISSETQEGIENLKEKLFKSFNKIRVYTKDPNKKEHDKERPVILKPGSTVKNVAEKIFHGFSDRVKETKIWGPSSKFPGQKVGLTRKLKDLDIVEFKTK